jgi:hypothetical protein
MMPEGKDRSARIFRVNSQFEQMARRPGGLAPAEAIARATKEIESKRPEFDGWYEERLGKLQTIIASAERGQVDAGWEYGANRICRELRDLAVTMGFELLAVVADSLCLLFDTIGANGSKNADSIRCHMDALILASKSRHLPLNPDQVEELTTGLRQIAKRFKTN